MEIKKFEAYTYRGPVISKLDRNTFIENLIDTFTDQKLFDYEVTSTTYFPKDEILWLHIDKEIGGKYSDAKIIKLDLSDLGIEIGTAEWNDDEDDFDDFQPELNLDTDITKRIKAYKNTLGKFNI